MRRSPPLVGAAVQGFSFLAVLTSCIGTSLSLSETLRTEVPPLVHQLAMRLGLEEGVGSGSNSSDCCSIASQAQQQRQRESCSDTQLEGGCPAPAQPQPAERRGLALALTLGPPLLFTLSRPDAFLGMLEVRAVFCVLYMVDVHRILSMLHVCASKCVPLGAALGEEKIWSVPSCVGRDAGRLLPPLRWCSGLGSGPACVQ